MMLKVLDNATISQVAQACRETAFTHIHVLTHGDVLPNNPDKYGICLGDAVIPGDQFATAISSLRDGGVHRPTVVTVASCDSGQVGSVITPGASFAHDLHQSGIPLVVASQFPLSKVGSVVMAGPLYRDLLMAENPLITLHKIRTELHSLYSADSHDWASLVVYEALPPDLDEQLQDFHYRQSKLSADAKLSVMDASLRSESPLDEQVLRQLVAAVEQARDRLPIDGPYATECLGLRASMAKRVAEAAFRAAIVRGTPRRRGGDTPLFLLSVPGAIGRSLLRGQPAYPGRYREAGAPYRHVALGRRAEALDRNRAGKGPFG